MLRPLAIACALAGTVCAQRILYVPGPYHSIGAALAAAGPNWTIAVLPGTYTEKLTWPNVQGIRLIAIGGPSVTTIDANGTGRAISFGRVRVTRSTVVEGFTISNGFLASDRNHGAGIHIDGGSPTIRGNVFTGNVCQGPSWNYGGAIYAHGGAPLIVGNTIRGNTCRNGSWNVGAGIYLSRSRGAEVLGNLISGNVGVGGDRAYGIGVFVSDDSVVSVSGNLFLNNSASSQFFSSGSALFVDFDIRPLATVHIVNNTFADNVIPSAAYPWGTVYIDGTGVRFSNNIVANNSPVGIHLASRGTMIADWNCVWGNGNNYVNTGPSPNDLTVDPRFVSPTDRHLSATSPCIDAGSDAHLPAGVTVDVDGDPRHCDGNLDGVNGNGARVDIGGDERCAARLVQTAPLTVGGSAQFRTDAPANWIAFTMLSGTEGHFELAPYGTYLLGPVFSILSIGPPPNTTTVPVPLMRVLAGQVLHLQSGAVPLSTPGTGTFTNRISATIF